MDEAAKNKLIGGWIGGQIGSGKSDMTAISRLMQQIEELKVKQDRAAGIYTKVCNNPFKGKRGRLKRKGRK